MERNTLSPKKTFLITGELIPNKILRHVIFVLLGGVIFWLLFQTKMVQPMSWLGFISFGFAIVMFTQMAKEDLVYGTVDIPMTALMTICMAFSAKNGAWVFLGETTVYLLLFLIIHTILAIIRTLLARIPNDEQNVAYADEKLFDEIDGDAVPKNAVPYLPCFFLAFLLFLSLFFWGSDYTYPLRVFQDVLNETIVQVPAHLFWQILAGLIIFYGLLRWIRYALGQKYRILYGMGMGDVIALSPMAAFIGSVYFSAVLIGSLIFLVPLAAYVKNNNEKEPKNDG